MDEKKLNITVFLNDKNSRVEVESDAMSPSELIMAGNAAIKVVARGVTEKLNKKEQKAFCNMISKFIENLRKELK